LFGEKGLEMKIRLIVFIAVLLISTTGAYAELHDRGGGLIYDDVLNVTWLQNANLAGTAMSWSEAIAWVADLEYGGYNDWRLQDSPATAQGFINEGEMGYLYYTELGNPAGGLRTNSGPFINIPPPSTAVYWLSAEPLHSGSAWSFSFDSGFQNAESDANPHFAWAVRDGDVEPQPFLLGWDYPNGLVTINPITADYTISFDSNRQFEAMAYDPENKLLYAIENLGGDNLLVIIDYINEIITDIGYVEGYTEITSMTFDRTTNTLYAIDQTTRTLLEIDPLTGIGTPITNYTLGTSNALAAHPLTGELYLGWSVDPSYLTIIDKTTGDLTIIGSMGINSVTALEFHPITHELYGAGQFYSGGHQLFTVDLGDGSAIPIGSLGQVLSLAFIDYPSEISIDAIINFFDEAVSAETIYGRGRKSCIANARLWIFGQMLQSAKRHLERGRINRACRTLNRIVRRCDGEPWPKDYIEGEAVPELYNMILDLMEIECE
jgi:hypothetical protein